MSVSVTAPYTNFTADSLAADANFTRGFCNAMLRAVNATAGVSCVVTGVTENTGAAAGSSGSLGRRLTTATLSVTVSYQLSYGSQA